MPVSFAQLANNTASVSFAVGEDTVTINYYPAHITEQTYAQMQSFGGEDLVRGFGVLNDMLAQLIQSWDVFEDDAKTQMYPLAPDRLAALPISFRLQCITTILRDLRPNAVTPQIQH